MQPASKCSNVQPEEARDQENDDDDADNVENVHVVFRSSHAPFQMKERRSRRKRPGLQLSSVQGDASCHDRKPVTEPWLMPGLTERIVMAGEAARSAPLNIAMQEAR